MVMLRTEDDNSANLERGAAHPPLLRRLGAFAVTLAFCGLVAAALERSEHRPRSVGHPEGVKAGAERVALSQRAIENFEQFAINALVFPLIDDTVPPRWTRHGIHWICNGRGKVAIDGMPLQEGEPIPARPFTVRWDLHRCPPFSGGELLADGEVELHVTPDGTDLHAYIAASSLTFDTPAGRFQLPAARHRGPADSSAEVAP